MVRLPHNEKIMLLHKRAARELEKSGYDLDKSADGCFTVLDGKTGKPIVKCEDIIRLGQLFGLWGQDILPKDPLEPPGRDKTGKETPELAAVREKARINAPPPAKLPKGPQPHGKASREAHRR